MIHRYYVTLKYYCQLGSKIQVMIYCLDILAYWLPEMQSGESLEKKKILNNFSKNDWMIALQMHPWQNYNSAMVIHHSNTSQNQDCWAKYQ